MNIHGEILHEVILASRKSDLQKILSEAEKSDIQRIKKLITFNNKELAGVRKRIQSKKGDLKGGALKASLIKDFFTGSHVENAPENIQSYELDSELSDRFTRVYHDKKKNWTTIVVRGTGSADPGDVFPRDILVDAKLLFGSKSDKRFTSAAKITEKAREKYDPSRMTLLGSSLGGAIINEINEKNPGVFEVITSGRPVLIADAIKGKPVPDNQTDVRTSTDPVSVLKPLQKGKNDITFKSKTPWDPVKSHVGNAVFSSVYIDPETLVGKKKEEEEKLDAAGVSGKQIDSMKIAELKSFIKNERKKRKLPAKDFKVTNLRKGDLKLMAKKLI
jgi:hypothetical protein